MANALYDKAREEFLGNGSNAIVWSSDTIKVMLVTSGYTVSLSAHQFVSDIGGGDIVARSVAFTSKTTTAGVANAANVVFPAQGGAAFSYLVIYKDTGVDATSPLIAYIDTATGLPCTPNGGDLTIAWDSGASKIFKL